MGAVFLTSSSLQTLVIGNAVHDRAPVPSSVYRMHRDTIKGQYAYTNLVLVVTRLV